MNYSGLSVTCAMCGDPHFFPMELNHSDQRRELCKGILPTFFQEEWVNATQDNKT